MSLFREAFRQVLKKPITIKYPFEPGVVPPGLRGKPVWDMNKCIPCMLCQNACPTSAIKAILKGPDTGIIYRLDRCIFCAECADVCPRKAVIITSEFELADFSKEGMTYHYKKGEVLQKK